MAAEEGLMGAWGSGDRLPVPVTPFGPLQALADRVHELNLRGRSVEALRAVDAYDPLVRLAGDERSARMLTQGRMYCLQALGRYHDAAEILGAAEAQAAGVVAPARQHRLALADGRAEQRLGLALVATDRGIHHPEQGDR